MAPLDVPTRLWKPHRLQVPGRLRRGVQTGDDGWDGRESPLLFLLQDFLCQIERYCRQCHLTTPITFPPEHPVEEVGRLLLCCLLKHEDLGRELSVSAAPWSLAHARPQRPSLPLCECLFQGTWRCLWFMPARSASSR